MQTCPVMYDLNRHLAEEAREEARAERLGDIATDIREEVETALFPLAGADTLPTEEAVKANARHEAAAAQLAIEMLEYANQHEMGEAFAALFRGRPEAKDMLAVVFENAVDAYVNSCARAELKRLEDIEAEDAALARAGV